MGEIGARLADVVVLTAEDPRSEPVEDILAEMARGAERGGAVEGQSYFRLADRAEAIQFAVDLAQPGDVVIACGKGHERSMCYGTVERPWSGGGGSGLGPRTTEALKALTTLRNAQCGQFLSVVPGRRHQPCDRYLESAGHMQRIDRDDARDGARPALRQQGRRLGRQVQRQVLQPFEQLIVFSERADPEPKDMISLAQSQGPIAEPDAYRVNRFSLAHALELQARMVRLRAPECLCPIGLLPERIKPLAKLPADARLHGSGTWTGKT